MNRTAAWFVSTALLVVVPARAVAQRYHLRDGRVLDAARTRVEDGRLAVALGEDGAGEVGYPIAHVARLEWPEPADLARARRALEEGRGAEAARLAAETTAAFALFPRTEGSWWGEARALEARALLALRRAGPAREAAAGLLAASPAPRLAAVARVVSAGADLLDGASGPAIARLEAELRAGDSGAEAEAAALLAAHRLAAEAWEPALEAALRVVVFHPRRRDLVPGALLAAARSYRGIGDAARAERAALELVDRFGGSAEAIAARREFLP